MFTQSQKMEQDTIHFPTANICSNIISQLIARSITQSESALFYRLEIEKCQEYISLMQAEATRTWVQPSKPEELQNIEDVEFFHSEFCLKNKLSIIQDDKLIAEQQKRRISKLARNNFIRGSVKSRASSFSVFSWSQQKYNSLKQRNEEKLRQKKGSRQLSLQKLAPTRKDVASKSEKELREVALNKHSDSQPVSKKRLHRKMVFRKKELMQPEDDGSMPILVEMAYNITSQPKAKNLDRKESLPKLEQAQKKLEKLQHGGKGRSRLVISEYQPNRNHIKVSCWRKFNELIDENNFNEYPQQFTNINYFIEETKP